MRGDPHLTPKFVNQESLGAKFSSWAHRSRSLEVLILLGSRARTGTRVGAADNRSDWDFQVVSTSPSMFDDSAWAIDAGLANALVYTSRPGRLGRVKKISGVFVQGEIDIALLPIAWMRVGKMLNRLKVGHQIAHVRSALGELSMVLAPGYQVLKGSLGWQRFFRDVVRGYPPSRLDNPAVIAAAQCFLCDYMSTFSKIDRGEFIAAQRWLHTQLAEVNFKLYYELRQRLNKPAFPDARRIEALEDECWREALSISAVPDQESLTNAVEKSAVSCCRLVHELVGSQWNWPMRPSNCPRWPGRHMK